MQGEAAIEQARRSGSGWVLVVGALALLLALAVTAYGPHRGSTASRSGTRADQILPVSAQGPVDGPSTGGAAADGPIPNGATAGGTATDGPVLVAAAN